ncbi:MAG: hypothetical protein SFU85_06015 [Candidatus Methylacidiphilales bacterium]|nr:hypothetical protein [Candidatus Methylacidiphilales bacterium]
MKPLILFILLSGIGLARDAACAGETARKADSNGDGLLDRKEWIAFLGEDLFSRMDRDGDGVVSRQEASRHAGLGVVRGLERPQVELGFDQVDRNRDGKITPMELRKALARQKNVEVVFDDYDIDNDLHLQKWELKEPPNNVGIQFRF